VKKPSLKISGVNSWYKTRRQKNKEKEELERSLESSSLKLFTFFVTAIAMGLGMSYLPIFPQPLPILIAVLVAFAVYRIPRLGMLVGGVVIGFGLMYHLAELEFISFLGDIPIRVAFVVAWLALFIALPIVSNRYKSALAIDFGIIAFTCLFFAPLYFLAIPLILASAVYFKKYVSFSVIYFVLLMVPLQIMQYYTYVVKPIIQSDWWVVPGSSPPLLIPLTSIAKDISGSVDQFRLYDLSKVMYDIAGQITWIPDWAGRTISDAVTQYRDSIPGLLMFVVIVVGLAVTLMFFTRMMVKEGVIGAGDKFFQCFTATIAAAVFFVLLSALQVPLAFTADVSPTTMVLGIFATFLLTIPVLFVDTTPKQTTSFSEVTKKAQALKDKLRILAEQLENVKETIPVIVSSPEGKMLVIKDSVDETLNNILMHAYDQSELDMKLREIANLSKDTDAIETELNTILAEYHLFSSCQFSDWMGRLKAAGLDVKTTLNGSYQKELPLEQRIQAIKDVLEQGRALTREVIDVAEPIYGIIKPLYDPSLPEKSRSVEFAQEKLATKEAPWIAIEALYNSLNNWKRQYGSDIKASMKYLRTSLTPIARLSRSGDLAPVFGENTRKVLGYAQKAEEMKANAEIRAEKEELDILDVIALKDDVQSFLRISNDVLTMLYSGLVSDEEAIDRLLPTKDYLWEKNSNLRDRLKNVTETLANPLSYKINQIMENLPTYLSYLEEAVQTLAVYSERKEFLLNYPLAEAAIEERLKEKQSLLPQDLPFPPRFAAEYLRLYYSTRFGEYAFDTDNLALTKRG
jgi:hypothetical protein